MSWGAVIVGGAALVGGALANRSNSQAAGAAAAAANNASVYQSQVVWDMYNQNREDMLPYMQSGTDALRQITGGSKMGLVDYYKLSNGITVPKDKWESYSNPEQVFKGTIIGQTQQLATISVPAMDPTGGAEKYLNQLNQVQFPSGVDPTGGAGQYLNELNNIDPTGGAQTYLDKLNSITFPTGVDPTGGMQKYIDQLDALEFELDTNDPIYKWRAAENERQVNQFMASRGQYDSRAAANMLLQSGMQLQADETERQYNQRYLSKFQQLTSLANLSYQKGMAEYGAATDKYNADINKNLNALNSALSLGQTRYGAVQDKLNSALQIGGMKYGAAVDKYNAETGRATQAFNAAMQLGNTNYNRLLDVVKAGTGASATAGQYGQNTANQLANISAINSNAQQNALLAQGKSQAQYYQGLSQLPMNMMAANYYMK